MVQIPQRLLGEALLNSAEKNPSKTAIIVRGEEYSYSDLKNKALALASHFHFSGIEKGDRIIIYMNNSWETAVSIYAISLAGAVFVVVNPQTKADKLNYIINNCQAKVIISESNLQYELIKALENAESVQEAIFTGKMIQPVEASYKISEFNRVSDNIKNETLPVVIPNDLAALIYTSGSTGFPKGVMQTHQSMVFASWSLIQYLRLTEDERILLVLPLAFDYGLYQLLMSVTLGATLIIEKSFTFPATVYQRIEQYKPTVFPGVPTIYAMMLSASNEEEKTFPSIRKITNTAAALSAEIIPGLKKMFPNTLIFKMYGLTECKRVCYLEPELIDKKPSSVGKAIPGTEVFLLSPEGEKVANGQPGILHVRGPHVMPGYWNAEDLSNEMLKPGLVPGEKVLCTNDWFKMDDEGFLYFLGRNDDIIKTRGEKVSPIEVENAIYKTKGVKEVAVVGVKDEIQGESIVAFVTKFNHSDTDENEIKKVCANNLEVFMIPQKIVFVDEMPKSPNGKIDKKELKKNYQL
ncbi:MAG: AMP-binding protein [Prolixibacteraceae bacterium]|nr:AMP-binding protein [Prolixibacteraceae bacterium]MBN2774885.1 AMP-binding protein [Prolixibacteraceae bacterium]